jgi:hypothetical protein
MLARLGTRVRVSRSTNYYRRFIANFSAVVAPQTDATKGEKKVFDWGGAQDRAFATISRPSLPPRYYDYRYRTGPLQ